MFIQLVKEGRVVVSASLPDMQFPADVPQVDVWLRSLGIGRNKDGSLFSYETLPFTPLGYRLRLSKGKKGTDQDQAAGHSLTRLESQIATYRNLRENMNCEWEDRRAMHLAASIALSTVKRTVFLCRDAGVPEEDIAGKFGKDTGLLKTFTN